MPCICNKYSVDTFRTSYILHLLIGFNFLELSVQSHPQVRFSSSQERKKCPKFVHNVTEQVRRVCIFFGRTRTCNHVSYSRTAEVKVSHHLVIMGIHIWKFRACLEWIFYPKKLIFLLLFHYFSRNF